jgi:hypothetical protein
MGSVAEKKTQFYSLMITIFAHGGIISDLIIIGADKEFEVSMNKSANALPCSSKSSYSTSSLIFVSLGIKSFPLTPD